MFTMLPTCTPSAHTSIATFTNTLPRIDPSTRLRRAIHLNDVLLVQRLVRTHPKLLLNPDFTDRSNTSLHLAAAHGFTEIVRFLIQAGHEDVEISRNADNETPLMLTAKGGHVEAGKLLVEAFPRCVIMTEKNGMDALGLCAQCAGSTALMPVLLSNAKYPASPHVRDQDGNTPLHHASASGSLKALRILLAAGANPLAKNNYDWTPLAYSQTVAAEVYFKNLVAEYERKKVEGARQGEEIQKQRAAGVRIVQEEAVNNPVTPIDDDEVLGDVLRRQWSPVERRRPMMPNSSPGRPHEWTSSSSIARARAGSGE